MRNEIREIMAAQVACGLIATHGIDHGGAPPGAIAEKSVAIADAILARCAGDEVPAASEEPETDPAFSQA